MNFPKQNKILTCTTLNETFVFIERHLYLKLDQSYFSKYSLLSINILLISKNCRIA